MDNDIFIYALIDPRNDEVKYIGATTEGHERYKRHCRDYYLKKSTLKNNWVKSLKKQNLLPIFQVIEYCKKEELNQTEAFYISYFRFLGFNLLNHNDLGYGIRPDVISTEEQKRRASLNFTKHPIINLETKEVFECIYDVLKRYKDITYVNLRKVLQKPDRSLSAKRIYFAYLVDGLDVEKELNKRKKTKFGIHRKKKVLETTTNTVFNSIKEAAETLKLNSTNISHSLAGKNKSTREFRFKYVK